jgi:hypothetical protein
LAFQQWQGSLKRRIVAQAGLGKKQDPVSKITIAKMAGSVVQVIELLLSRHKALSSNPSTS